MNKNIVWVRIETNKYYQVLLKLNNIGLDIYDIKKFSDYILIKVDFSDYKRIKKYLISYKVEIYSSTGLYKLKEVIKKYFIFMCASLVGIILLFMINNIIFKVDVKSNNESIKMLLIEKLEDYGLGKMRFKKSHKEIEVIVNEILESTKEQIKWLEVKYDGLIMIVNVVETTKEDTLNEDEYCNVVASKDAKISSMNVYRGIALKEINDYVLKGDILLSGTVTHNEEVKNMVCASGEVYGEVWYKVKVEVPFLEEVKEYTGKNRYNMNVLLNDNVYNIFKSRVNQSDKKLINIYKLNDFEINLVKEKEYVITSKKLTEEEAYQKGIQIALDKINLLLEEDEEILYQKVLKNEVNDSTIYLEIFIVVKENIGYVQVVEKGNENDIEINS